MWGSRELSATDVESTHPGSSGPGSGDTMLMTICALIAWLHGTKTVERGQHPSLSYNAIGRQGCWPGLCAEQTRVEASVIQRRHSRL